MSEAPKAQAKVRMRRTADSATVELDPMTARQAARSYSPGSNVPDYTFIDPVVGFQKLNDGGIMAVEFDPEKAMEVASGRDSWSSLALGPDDPRFEQANAYRRDQIITNIARNRGSARVALERAANVLSFGMYSALADDDPVEAEIRARANEKHAIASGVGTVAGVVGTVLFPYGRFAGVLGKGAMAAGKASGMVRASQTAKGAFEIGKTTNLLKASAKVAQRVRAKYPNNLFLQNYGGGLAGAAVAEAPLSLAIAAADITDYNKPFSAQAIVADAGSLFLIGMGISGALGVVGAGARSALEVGRGKFLASQIGVGRAVGRRLSYRLHPLVGAPANSLLQRTGQRLQKMARSSTAKMITGVETPPLIGGPRTLRQAAKDLHGLYHSPKQFEKAAKDFLTALDGESAATLRTAIDQAPLMINARKTVQITARNLPMYSRRLSQYSLKSLDDVAVSPSVGSMQVAVDRLAKSVAATDKTLGAKIQKIADGLTGVRSGKQVLRQGFEARKLGMQAGGQSKIPALKQIDEAFATLTGSDARVMQELADFDGFAKSLHDLNELMRTVDTSDFTAGAAGGVRMAERSRQMADFGSGLRFADDVTNQLRRDAEAMMNADMLQGMETLSNVNALRKRLLFDENALREAIGLPGGQLGKFTHDELLESQVSTVSAFKLRTASALKYLTVASSPRGAAAFHGVLMYRAMTAGEKRTTFAEASDLLTNSASTPEQLMSSVAPTAGEVTSHDMELGTQYAITLATSQSYLLSQLPRSADPMIGPEHMSMSEIESFLERVGALEDPASVLASAKDGSVSPEAVDALRVVYPELYSDMVLDVSEFMNTPDWDKLSINQLIGLDTFTGGALGVLESYGTPNHSLYAQTPAQQHALGKNLQQASPDVARAQSRMNQTETQKVGAL